MAPKVENDPESITQKEYVDVPRELVNLLISTYSASFISSRETQALGGRQKGGVAAQAQSLADQKKSGGGGGVGGGQTGSTGSTGATGLSGGSREGG